MMELDELKQNWNASADLNQVPAYRLTELINTKSIGSLTILKNKYRKQAIILPAAAVFLLLFLLQKPILQQNALIWFIIPVMLLLALHYYRHYRLVLEMEQSNSKSVKGSIRKNIDLLNRSSRQQLLFASILLISLILILEASLFFQHPSAFAFWQNTFLPIRITTYGLLIFLQPLLTRYFFDLNFGRYINDLEALLDQTD